MQTHPHVRPDGTLQSFEISSGWLTFGPIYRALGSVSGVEDVKRNRSGDDRITFTFHGRPCIIKEPFGDNSRYWVGPDVMEPPIDMTPVHEAFRSLPSFPNLRTEKVRPLVMLAAVSFLLPLGEVIVLRRPLAPMDPVTIIDALLFIFATYWWYTLDRRERGFRTGTFQNMGIVVVPPIALSIYFIRSRGWARGLLATVVAFIVFVASGALSVWGEEIGRRIAL